MKNLHFQLNLTDRRNYLLAQLFRCLLEKADTEARPLKSSLFQVSFGLDATCLLYKLSIPIVYLLEVTWNKDSRQSVIHKIESCSTVLPTGIIPVSCLLSPTMHTDMT